MWPNYQQKLGKLAVKAKQLAIRGLEVIFHYGSILINMVIKYSIELYKYLEKGCHNLIEYV